MERSSCEALSEMRDVLLETYAVNDAMNQLLLAHLDPRAWRAQLAGTKPRAGRTIAAVFAHLHNSRLVWPRSQAPHLKCPAPLDLFRCTMKQAAAAHARSPEQWLRMLTDSLSATPERRVSRGHGRLGPACLPICFRMKRITGDRSSGLRMNWVPGRRLGREVASGNGTSRGRSMGLRGRPRQASVQQKSAPPE